MTTSCSVGLDRLPLAAPGASGDTYRIEADFANVLNLPDRAHVKLAGADVGVVESISAREFTAVVGMRIRSDVVLPVGTTAELRSATPLGDVFVAVKPPDVRPPDGVVMRDGDRIPLASTSAAATVESLLTTTSLLVNGGVVRNLTDVLNGAGRAVGDRGDKLGDLIEHTTALLRTTNGRSAEITAALQQSSRLADTLSAQQATIDDVLSSADPATSALSANKDRILDLVDQLNRITAQLQRFPSVSGTDNRSLVADLNSLSAAFSAVIVDPNTSLDALTNLVGIALKSTSSSGIMVDADVAKLVWGWRPGRDGPGDPGLRGPNRSDWNAFIGSLTYTIYQLRERLRGPDR